MGNETNVFESSLASVFFNIFYDLGNKTTSRVLLVRINFWNLLSRILNWWNSAWADLRYKFDTKGAVNTCRSRSYAIRNGSGGGGGIIFWISFTYPFFFRIILLCLLRLVFISCEHTLFFFSPSYSLLIIMQNYCYQSICRKFVILSHRFDYWWWYSRRFYTVIGLFL